MEIARFFLRSYSLNLMGNLRLTRTEKTFKAENRPTREFLGRRKLNESWGEFMSILIAIEAQKTKPERLIVQNSKNRSL